MNQKQLKALQLIDRFNPKCIENTTAFKKINLQEFLDSLKTLISNPQGISQGNHPICGVSCAVKIAAQLDPVGLVKMSAYLFANGEFRLRSFLVKPIKSPANLRKTIPIAGLTPANHVIQTTLKSFFNPITGYNNKPGTKFNEWQGITFPYQLRSFLTSYFKIKEVPVSTYHHTIESLQTLIADDTILMAWTSWNQMKNPGGRFKLLEQHYVILKAIEVVGNSVHLTIDNPRNAGENLQKINFNSEKDFYKAIIGVFGFKTRL